MKQTCAPRETLAIAGYALGGKKWDGLYLGRRKGDDLIYAGKVDYSFDSASAKDLQTRLKPLIRKTRPYAKKDSTSRHLGRTVAAGGNRVRGEVCGGEKSSSRTPLKNGWRTYSTSCRRFLDAGGQDYELKI
jgi:ATP-dependent DNA ligase